VNYETTPEVEIALSRYFGIRANLIVPNIDWGLFPYEVDLAILKPSGFVYEVEIKISKADLLADRKKRHNHFTNMIKYLWFAMPEKMEECHIYIPIKAGIYLVTKKGIVWEYRKPLRNKTARKLTDEEKYQFARLGAMRIWGLKEALRK